MTNAFYNKVKEAISNDEEMSFSTAHLIPLCQVKYLKKEMKISQRKSQTKLIKKKKSVSKVRSLRQGDNKKKSSVIHYLNSRRQALIEKRKSKMDSSLIDLQMRVVFNTKKKSKLKRVNTKRFDLFETSSDEPMDQPPTYKVNATKHSQSQDTIKRNSDIFGKENKRSKIC